MSNIIAFKPARLLPGVSVPSRRVKALDEFERMFARPVAGASRSSPSPEHPAPESKALPPLTIIARGNKALKKLAGFIGKSQLATVKDCLKGEEGQWFMEKMEELDAIVESMPVTYGQNGKGDDAICYLHYFVGGYDAYITEKDMEEAEDPAEAQWQAFGFVRFAHMPGDGSLGYICLPEILGNRAELDFHFTPKTLREVKRGLGIEVEEAAAGTCLNSDSAAEDAAAVAEFDAATPQDRLRHHVTGAIERGEAEAITAIEIHDVLAEKQKAFLAMEDGYQAGAIISYSWGWEQTNYNYYLIEKRSGEWVTLRPLRSHVITTGDMHTDDWPTDTPKDPAKDFDPAWGEREKAIKNPTFRRKLCLRDGKPSGFSISSGTGWARLWEGRAGKATHYA
jgi:hypothetical protein